MLTNNPYKVKHLESNGYALERVPLMGEINAAGAQEAKERGLDFQHLDISEERVTFKNDFLRLKKVLTKIFYAKAPRKIRRG